jgi:hypothetical protein
MIKKNFQIDPDISPAANIAAFYYWLFPNLMLNFYPWGLSLNVVYPLGPERTRVSFLSYVWDEARRQSGVGADLHRLEMEDEEVVESVQRGCVRVFTIAAATRRAAKLARITSTNFWRVF